MELNLSYDPSVSVLILNKKIRNYNYFFKSSHCCCKDESTCKYGATCSVLCVACGTLRRGCDRGRVCRVACRTPCAASSWCFCFTIDQLRGLLAGNTLPQRGGSWRSWRWLPFRYHSGWHASLSLWATEGGNVRDDDTTVMTESSLNREFKALYLDAVLLAGDSLLLLLLFMACRVCLSVVCRVCLSVLCLLSLSVRPWIAL